MGKFITKNGFIQDKISQTGSTGMRKFFKPIICVVKKINKLNAKNLLENDGTCNEIYLLATPLQ